MIWYRLALWTCRADLRLIAPSPYTTPLSPIIEGLIVAKVSNVMHTLHARTAADWNGAYIEECDRREGPRRTELSIIRDGRRHCICLEDAKKWVSDKARAIGEVMAPPRLDRPRFASYR